MKLIDKNDKMYDIKYWTSNQAWLKNDDGTIAGDYQVGVIFDLGVENASEILSEILNGIGSHALDTFRITHDDVEQFAVDGAIFMASAFETTRDENDCVIGNGLNVDFIIK